MPGLLVSEQALAPPSYELNGAESVAAEFDRLPPPRLPLGGWLIGKALSKPQRILARLTAFAEWPAIECERQLVPGAITFR